LVLLIGGGTVVAVTETEARIRMPSGRTQTFTRRSAPGRIAVWQAAA